MLKTLVLATNNSHKVRELRSMLDGMDVEIRTLGDFPQCGEVVEDGLTLEENALKKARAAFRCSGLPSIADDTGLEVYYLLGAPGVYSARYAGEHCSFADNNRKLLKEMTQVPTRRRQARFRCVIAFVAPGIERTFEGSVEGSILRQNRGANGFGYDPVFLVTEAGKTLAEMTLEEKNAVSHRARALTAFVDHLRSA